VCARACKERTRQTCASATVLRVEEECAAGYSRGGVCGWVPSGTLLLVDHAPLVRVSSTPRRVTCSAAWKAARVSFAMRTSLSSASSAAFSSAATTWLRSSSAIEPLTTACAHSKHKGRSPADMAAMSCALTPPPPLPPSLDERSCPTLWMAARITRRASCCSSGSPRCRTRRFLSSASDCVSDLSCALSWGAASKRSVLPSARLACKNTQCMGCS